MHNGRKPKDESLVPLGAVTKLLPEDLKILTMERTGEYIPFSFYQVENAEQLMKYSEELVTANQR